MAKKQTKKYRAVTHINTEPHTNPGDEFNPSLVSEETLSVFLILGLVVEETGDAPVTGEENG